MRSSVELKTFLLENAISHEFFRTGHAARRLEDAAAGIGIDDDDVAMPTVLSGRDVAALAVTPLGIPAQPDLVARALDLPPLRRAGEARASALTGFPANWIPPVAMESHLLTVVDTAVAARDVIYGAAGEPGLLVAIRVAELIAATKAAAAPIAVLPGRRHRQTR